MDIQKYDINDNYWIDVNDPLYYLVHNVSL